MTDNIAVSYRDRYKNRWRWTVIAVGLLMVVLQMIAADDPTVANLIGAFLIGGLVFGSLLNLVVAALPANRSA